MWQLQFNYASCGATNVELDETFKALPINPKKEGVSPSFMPIQPLWDTDPIRVHYYIHAALPNPNARIPN